MPSITKRSCLTGFFFFFCYSPTFSGWLCGEYGLLYVRQLQHQALSIRTRVSQSNRQLVWNQEFVRAPVRSRCTSRYLKRIRIFQIELKIVHQRLTNDTSFSYDFFQRFRVIRTKATRSRWIRARPARRFAKSMLHWPSQCKEKLPNSRPASVRSQSLRSTRPQDSSPSR